MNLLGCSQAAAGVVFHLGTLCVSVHHAEVNPVFCENPFVEFLSTALSLRCNYLYACHACKPIGFHPVFKIIDDSFRAEFAVLRIFKVSAAGFIFCSSRLSHIGVRA
jgi:hypothetical protein